MFLFFTSVSFSSSDVFDYDKAWKEVDKALEKGLPKTALDQINIIYDKALSESNVENQIKATISGAKLTLDTEELGLELVVETLNARLNQSKAPVKQLLHSMTAELFQQYYNSQYYKISQRTNLASFDTGDMRTWAPNNYRDFIADQYLSSTADITRQYKTADYKKLLNNEKSTIALRPALYDVLVDRAINYFSSRNYNTITPSFSFKLDSPDYLADVQTFIDMDILTDEIDSKIYRAIKLFQDQLKYQSSFSNQTVLASYDLKRLEFVLNFGMIADANTVFESSLRQASSYYQGNDAHQFILRLSQNYINSERYQEALDLLDELEDDKIEPFVKSQKQNFINTIHTQQLSLQSEQVVSSKKNFLINVSSRNLETIYFKLLKVDQKDFSDILASKQKDQYKKIESLLVLKTWNRSNIKDGYKQSTYEELMEGLEYGIYILVSSNTSRFNMEDSAYNFTAFHVSDLAYTTYGESNGKRMFIRNRSTGKPVENVEIEVYTRQYNRKERKQELKLVQTTRSDKGGWADIKMVDNNSFLYKLTKGEDKLNLDMYDYYYKHRDSKVKEERTEIFLDRAIYRPGQTVHFKTISLDIDVDGLPTIHEGKSLVLHLKDANGQEVDKISVKANDFGSASGSFVLPTGRLTGTFSIAVEHGYKYFEVEEYKRPKFDVLIDSLDEELSLGDNIEVSGVATALSGSPISGAKVKYKIMRQTYYGWWSWYRRVPSSSEMIEQGDIKTDQSGKFVVDFVAAADANMKIEENPRYSYQIAVDVTDISGETRSATKNISIAALPYTYAIDMAEVIDVKSLKEVNVKAITVNDLSLNSDATIKVIELIQPDTWKRSRRWSNPSNPIYRKGEFDKKIERIAYRNSSVLSEYEDKEVVYEGSLNIPAGGSDVDISKHVVAGSSYRIEIISDEKYKGTNIITKNYIAVTDVKANKYPTLDLLYVTPKTNEAKVGEKYEVILGTCDSNLQVYYTFVRDYKIVHRGVADLNNNFTICYEPTEKDRGGISLYMDYVKHNYYKRIEQNVNIPWDHKKLSVELMTKRDKILPRSKEEWTIKVSGPNKDKAIAEVLATMYDASLDQFVDHEYVFNPYVSHYGNLQSQNFGFDYGYSGNLNYKWNRVKNEYVPMPILPSLKGMIINGIYNQMYGNGGGRRMMKRSSNESARNSVDEVMASPMMAESVIMEAEADYDSSHKNEAENLDNDGKDIQSTQKISVRKNLNESVFFYPNLKTDSDGNLLISFTMNEALTTWKLITFAHDKELRYGMTSHEVKTQKDVMILPNAPRFLREGDKIIFPATVSNLSENDLMIGAELEFIDPDTDQVINEVFGIKQKRTSIDVRSGESARIDWEINVPSNYKKIVKYRVIATSGDHTDGEENLLPVVTNQVLLTETKVLSVKKNEKKSFVFDALSSGSGTAQPHSYTFEYTSNPIWYAVQALPYLMEYPHQCTEQIFNKMYANTMASHIANANPKIKQIFEEWKTLDSDALLSNLEKNTELKSAILEETPWVRQAKSETEQKKRIALLFDMNKISNETASVLEELARSQMPSGAFPWFAGGRENVYITQNVIEGIAHLLHLGIISDQDRRYMQIVEKALVYLDEQTKIRYDRLKSNIAKHGGDINKDHLDQLSIHYLYIRSFYSDKKVQSVSQEANDYYFGQAKKYWLNKGLYLEAMLGLVMKRSKSNVALDIAKSLKERSFYSDELGRYWNLGSGFHWYELPIESHAMILEFFTEMKEQQDFVEDMKIWLLKNKQTNHWKTTKATSAAIYSLLIQGEDRGMISWIDENNTPEISLGDTNIDIASEGSEAGTGYFKKSWSASEITSDLSKISIQNNNESISWGAAYYQYFEDLDKVDNFQETPLTVNRNLFVEEMTDSGPQLVSIDKNGVQPGDRLIIRIEIRVDRNMSYVHLKDMRSCGFEPENVLSGYRWEGGLGYYESTRDLASHFFISHLNKGTYVFEYPVRAVHKGDFSSGITSIQSMYAPEFISHSNGGRVTVE